MDIDAAGVFQIAAAVAGIPVLVVMLRRRGTDRDPVPSGEPPIEPSGLAAPVACMFAWLIAGLAIQGAFHAALKDNPSVLLRLTILAATNGLAILAGIAVLKAIKGRVPWRPAPPLPSAAAGALAAVAFLPVGMLLYLGSMFLQSALLGIDPPPQDLIQQATSGDPVAFAAVLAFGVIGAPLLEEAFFRGFLYAGLRRHGSPAMAAGVSAVAFAALHIEAQNFAVVPPLIVLALFLAYLRERTGGLLAPIVMHCVYNTVQMVGVLLQAGDSL